MLERNWPPQCLSGPHGVILKANITSQKEILTLNYAKSIFGSY